MLEILGRGDVAIMDRGFPARWLLAMLVDRGIDLVMRVTAVKAGSWPEIVEFLASGSKSAVISCNLSFAMEGSAHIGGGNGLGFANSAATRGYSDLDH